MPYSADSHTTPSAAHLRETIPGWGADLDHADRPSVPKEIDALPQTGTDGSMPERQPGGENRERSIEHTMLPPVFGTAQPLRGVSGAVRRYAYDRFSEGRAAHWLLLVAGDRVETWGAVFASLASRRPDDPITETGILGEFSRGPIRSRRGRVDNRHMWIDPILVVAPWVVGGVVVVTVARKLLVRH